MCASTAPHYLISQHSIGARTRRCAVVVADLDEARAREVAAQVERAGAGGVAVPTDVRSEPQVRALVATALERFGQVDLVCSNAGVAFGRGLDAGDEDWALAWSVNVMAHVYAAGAALPAMLGRGEGYLLQTCSAAGLLTSPGDAPYTLSKHAAVAFAEWLAIAYGDRGVKVSALCPQGETFYTDTRRTPVRWRVSCPLRPNRPRLHPRAPSLESQPGP